MRSAQLIELSPLVEVFDYRSRHIVVEQLYTSLQKRISQTKEKSRVNTHLLSRIELHQPFAAVGSTDIVY